MEAGGEGGGGGQVPAGAAGARADVAQLGAALFRLATGLLPFLEEEGEDVARDTSDEEGDDEGEGDNDNEEEEENDEDTDGPAPNTPALFGPPEPRLSPSEREHAAKLASVADEQWAEMAKAVRGFARSWGVTREQLAQVALVREECPVLATAERRLVGSAAVPGRELFWLVYFGKLPLERLSQQPQLATTAVLQARDALLALEAATDDDAPTWCSDSGTDDGFVAVRCATAVGRPLVRHGRVPSSSNSEWSYVGDSDLDAP